MDAVIRIPALERPRSFPFHSSGIFYELDFLREDGDLLRAVRECCALQKSASAEQLARFVPDPRAEYEASPDALESILSSGEDISDVRTHGIADYLIFNEVGLEGSVDSEPVRAARREVDRLVAVALRSFFREATAICLSGHFLYPPGSYIGWHTNSLVPGWRLYINVVEEPDRSYFRFRDPRNGEIVTSMDEGVNFRMFRFADPGEPDLWHAVYTGTHRYSFGYRIELAPSLPRRALGRVRHLARGLLERSNRAS